MADHFNANVNRDIILPFDLTFNETNVMEKYKNSLNNHTTEHDDSDELIPPEYVQKLEENEDVFDDDDEVESSTTKSDRLIKSQDASPSLPIRNGILALPKNLKLRLKVVYDQSFHDLMRGLKLWPVNAINYMANMVKEIFVLPGLDTILELDVAGGRVVTYYVMAKSSFIKCF